VKNKKAFGGNRETQRNGLMRIISASIPTRKWPGAACLAKSISINNKYYFYYNINGALLES
jgi:hypothetical protein